MAYGNAITSNFIFVTCNVGSEQALKAELRMSHPDLLPAFSRPGFVTFKADTALPDVFELRSVFGRAYALSLGRAAHLADVVNDAQRLASGERMRLHVWARDDAPLDSVVRAELLASDLFHKDELACDDDRVFSVVQIEADLWYYGMHRHTEAHSRYAGGNPRIELPPEAPSRAYLKIEEALTLSDLPIKANDTVVELGCAPGGGSFALLNRGLQVIGIDPAVVDEEVRCRDNFVHITERVGHVRVEQLPANVHWLVSDMNVAPLGALKAVMRIARFRHDTLLGMVLTLKLNDWRKIKEIPVYLEELAQAQMVRTRALQLPSNRQEICVVALSSRGELRLRSLQKGRASKDMSA